MTAAITSQPDLCGFEPLKLEVVTEDGSSSGQTVVVEGGTPNIQVCLEPDVEAILQNLIEVFRGGG
jgi:inosine-uridine nucleoside N-ribohydrolase